MLECLLGLLLFTFICLLASGYLTYAHQISQHLRNASEKEWQVFLVQLDRELEGLEIVTVEPNYLQLFDRAKAYSVLIEFKYNKIVRTANGGYQPLLTRVSQATFRRQNDGVVIDVLFENGLTQSCTQAFSKEWSQ